MPSYLESKLLPFQRGVVRRDERKKKKKTRREEEEEEERSGGRRIEMIGRTGRKRTDRGFDEPAIHQLGSCGLFIVEYARLLGVTLGTCNSLIFRFISGVMYLFDLVVVYHLYIQIIILSCCIFVCICTLLFIHI